MSNYIDRIKAHFPEMSQYAINTIPMGFCPGDFFGAGYPNSTCGNFCRRQTLSDGAVPTDICQHCWNDEVFNNDESEYTEECASCAFADGELEELATKNKEE